MLISKARYKRDMASLRAENGRLRSERDTANSQRDTAIYNREQILSQLAQADGANRRLYGRNLELGSRITALTEADPEYTAVLDLRVARLRRVGTRILAAYGSEHRRADRLQQRLDDAVGLPAAGIRDSQRWQPGYVEPKADKS